MFSKKERVRFLQRLMLNRNRTVSVGRIGIEKQGREYRSVRISSSWSHVSKIEKIEETMIKRQ